MMKWIMTAAAVLAVAFFTYQYFIGRNGETDNTKRIHKSVKDKKIAGVCGGIAEYLNADPTFIRLAFALLFLGWGSGIAAYIILALILPEGE